MSRARIGVIALLALTFIAAACAQPPSGGTGGLLNATTWSTNPKDTDPQISSDATFTNLAYAPVGPARGRLAVVLHGTGSSPQAYTELAGALRGSGFHVIVLRYSAALGTQGACPDANAATDPDCFRVFRSETVFGANVADPTGHAYDQPLAAISQSNSVMNRLLKYVEYLRTVTPSAGWDQFQQRSGTTCTQPNTTYGACNLKWDKVVGVGHSQGAGVALYLAKFFPLDRVAMLSGSFDAFDLGDGSFTVAPWITEGGLAVPASRIGTLTHYSDYGLGRIRAVEDALGVPGPEVSASSPPPFDGSRRLMTNVASTCPWDSAPGHNSTAVDLCVPDYAYSSAWTYLAGV
jgi:pimeloyl-ACP methyl ester carboxylesterase